MKTKNFSHCQAIAMLLLMLSAFSVHAQDPVEKVNVYRFVILAGDTKTLKAHVTVDYADKSFSKKTSLGDAFELPIEGAVASIRITVEAPGHETFVRFLELPENSDPSSPIRIDASDFFTVDIEKDHFSAQEPFKVAVLPFDNTDVRAQGRGLGKTVSTMMVSFLKDNSQFSVFEREGTGTLLEEWRKMQTGQTDEDQSSLEEARRLKRDLTLKGLDGIILGAVSIVGNSHGKDLVEVDARLLRLDASIQAVAHGSDGEECLRYLVQQVGRSLEQKTLAPHYGELEIHVDSPERVWIHLAPVHLEEDQGASYEVRAELGFSLDRGDFRRGPVQSLWITDPKRYVIDDILSGYYTLRLSRAGYEELSTKNVDWKLRREGEELVPYYRGVRVPEDSELHGLLVEVKPDERTVIDRQFVLKKSAGSVIPDLKYDFPPVGEVVPAIELTPVELDRDHWPPQPSRGCREAEGSDRNLGNEKRYFEGFTTGYGDSNLAHGYSSKMIYELPSEELENLASGTYRMRVHIPDYEEWESEFFLEGRTNVEVKLQRKRGAFTLLTTQPMLESRIYLEGQTTGFQTSQSLATGSQIILEGLPWDTYRAFTDIEGFAAWEEYFSPELSRNRPRVTKEEPEAETEPGASEESPEVEADDCGRPVIKSQMWITGDDVAPAPNLYYDSCFEQLLDKILTGSSPQPTTSVEVGVDVLTSPGANRSLQSLYEDNDLQQQFKRRLLNQDLIVLNDDSFALIRGQPGLAGNLRAFITRGGVLLTFLSKPGDYQQILGASIAVTGATAPKKIVLKTGNVPNFAGKIIRKKTPWKFATLRLGTSKDEWRVLTVHKKLKNPLILERPVGAGFIIVIATSSKVFHATIHDLWSKVLRRAVLLAQFSMFRRYDGESGAMVTEARKKLETTQVKY